MPESSRSFRYNESPQMIKEIANYKKLHQKMDLMIEQLCPLAYLEGKRENGIRSLEGCWKFTKDIVKELVYQRKRADMLEAELECMEQEKSTRNLGFLYYR